MDRDGTIVAVPGGTLTYGFDVINDGPVDGVRRDGDGSARGRT